MDEFTKEMKHRKFTKAIVRIPGMSLVNGLTTASLGEPDYTKALFQHEKYIKALRDCGLEVTILEADEKYPDSCFVEDVALCTSKCTVITNPGAGSRKGETESITPVLRQFFTDIEFIREPATVEAGDIMMVDDLFFIGISERTNMKGAIEVAGILGKYGFTSSIVELKEVLHLKTGVAYLGENNLLACGEFLQKDVFKNFNLIEIPEEESYAANCIRVNDFVMIPAGYPKTSKLIRAAGYKILEVDVSEFRKLDGGLSCLSLRF